MHEIVTLNYGKKWLRDIARAAFPKQKKMHAGSVFHIGQQWPYWRTHFPQFGSVVDAS